MSLNRFGNVVPIQMDMLSLIGYRLGRGHSGLDIPEAERLANMREGLASLRRETGQDYGYDLAAWHEYLIIYAEEHGYTHPYGFEGVRRAVEEAIRDPEWPHLARLARETA